MPKKLQRHVTAAPVKQPASAPPRDKPRLTLLTGKRVTPKLLAQFTSQLAVLLDAGIPVAKCLRILEGQTPAGALKRILQEVRDDVEGGTALSEAMAKHARVFDRLYTNMVRAGEAGGVQDVILNRLAQFMDKSEEIKGRVRGALAYPIAVLGVAALVLTLVFVFVVPQFREIFRSQLGGEKEMPALTRLVIDVGDHMRGYWWVYLLTAVALVALHRLLLARVLGYRAWRDRLALRLPMFGALIRKSLVARFSRTFGTLIQSGVPHLEALEIVGGSIANMRLGDAIRRIHSSIREGAGIAVPMGESGIFDDVVVNMVDVGEHTGELDRMLGKIADRYESEVDQTVTITFKIIEPILLVGLAVIVGVIVFALFSPLLKILDKLRQH